MGIVLLNLIPAILILFPITVLLRQYQLTHSKDYLIFAIGFISILFEILLDVVMLVNNIPNVEETHISQNLYLLLVKIRYLNFTIPATTFYFVGKRSRYEKMIDKRSMILIISWMVIAIFVLQMDLVEIPKKTKFLFFTVYSSVESGNIGILYNSNLLSIGQGYEFILIFYQSVGISYLLYSFVRLENTYDYHNFKKIVMFWSFTLSFFILGNIFKLFLLLDFELLSSSQIETIQFLSFFLVAILSIFYSEGLLLSRIQIHRVFQLYKEKDKFKMNEKSGLNSGFMSKPTDYLRHVEKHYDEDKSSK